MTRLSLGSVISQFLKNEINKSPSLHIGSKSKKVRKDYTKFQAHTLDQEWALTMSISNSFQLLVTITFTIWCK